MTAPTRIPSSSRSPRAPRRVRSLALLLGATATAGAASLALGLAAPTAQADPGDTFVPLGTSRLLQSEDLDAIRVPLHTGTFTTGADSYFSACVGEGLWSDVLPGTGLPVGATWKNRRAADGALYESVGQETTPARATKRAATLVRVGIRNCQGSSAPFDFHFGKTTSFRVGSGYATVAPSYRGTATRPDGGVVVVRKGASFGLIDVSGTWGPVDQTLESVAKEAVNRLP